MSATDPRIHLAIDNCFASKRWTTPEAWSALVSNELGLTCIEASADTENDPLYSPPSYRKRWIKAVDNAQQQYGTRVVNLYSGHGTYATIGLAHTDDQCADHLLERWFKPQCRTAGKLGAGFGFFAHALPLTVLEESTAYNSAMRKLIDRLATITSYAADHGVTTLSLEQMYTPHQPPWTIDGSIDLMKKVKRQAKANLYLTIDVGHQSGQIRFLKPKAKVLRQWMKDPFDPIPWVGSQAAHQKLVESVNHPQRTHATILKSIVDDMDQHPWMFAQTIDADPYAWLSHLGCWSPIVHLQQTDGTTSSHRPFTAPFNQTGIITPEKVLAALAAAYRQPTRQGLPPRCKDIYLTLEVFSATADKPADIIERQRKSIAYWRKAIPEDGIPLSKLSI